jgi:membrane protease YdiL (CAAX protease family)
LIGSLVLVRGRWQLETFLLRLMLVLICFYAGVILGAWAQKMAGPTRHSAAQMIVATLSFQGATLVLVWRFMREHQTTWNELFGLSNRRVHALLFGIIAACVFLPIGERLQRLSYVAMENLPRLAAKPREQEAVQTLRVSRSWFDRVILGGVTILLAPVGEELLFRGIIYPWIKQLGFRHLALWLTSILFAAVHANLVIFLPLFVLAIILTLLYEHTNNLLAPITAHALFNAMNFAMLYLSETG